VAWDYDAQDALYIFFAPVRDILHRFAPALHRFARCDDVCDAVPIEGPHALDNLHEFFGSTNNQRSGRKLKPWEVSSAKIRHSGKVQCFSAKEDSYASPLA